MLIAPEERNPMLIPIIVVVLLVLAILALVIYCCCKKKKLEPEKPFRVMAAPLEEESIILPLVPLPIVLFELAEEAISLRNPKLGFGINLTPLVT